MTWLLQKRNKFGPNSCSLCKEAVLTFGEQKWGGIRYCQGCIKETFGWVQLSAEQRDTMMALFAAAAAMPRMQKALAKNSELTPELLDSIAVGEASRRVMQAAIDESR